MVAETLGELLTQGVARIGELKVRREGEGVVIEGPSDSGEQEVLAPDGEAVREHVKADDRGRYRPLSGARTLPTGWRVVARSVEEAAMVVEAVYPLALVHMRAARHGDLRCVGLDEVLGRQSGRYEVTSSLGTAGREVVSDVVCGHCVRVPAWRAGEVVKAGEIPCPEPCSVLVALAREAALWQREMPEPAPVDATVPFAAFDQPGNELREELLQRLRRL